MKLHFSIIILNFIAQSLFGQSDVEKLIIQADSLFGVERPMEALAIMEGLVTRQEPIDGYSRLKTQIGITYYNIDSVEKARKWFLNVIRDPLINDDIDDFWLGNMEVKGNYKHVSCYNMALSYYKEGDYEESIKYYKLALDSFPYYHFSGSDINKSKVKICRNIADLYSKKGDLTSAFFYLSPFFNDFTIYSERARNKFAQIIKEHQLTYYYLEILKKDYTILIENETILLNLNGTKIILKEMTGKSNSKNKIDEEAKYYWRLINNQDIISELKN